MASHSTHINNTSTNEMSQKQNAIISSVNSCSPSYVQPKLTVSSQTDAFEHEAESMADHVMRTPENNFIQRKCADCENEEKEIQRKSITPFIQTKTKSFNQTGDHLSSTINASRGSGQSLDQQTKSFMESRFRNDFSSVNIHTGSDAVQLNRELNAQAFTTGSDIYFNEGKYQPHTDSGKHLLAHELTHVVQQKSGLKTIQRQQAPPLTWAQRVRGAGLGTNLIEDDRRLLVRDAIGTGFTVVQSTNSDQTVDAAIASGNYQAWDSSTKKVNYDDNFNNKVSTPTQYGMSKFNRVGTVSTFYIVLGPQSLKPEGPEYTQMANRHEQGHAQDFASQGTTPHAATTGEELRIYTDGFINFVIPLTVFDNAACTYNLGEAFDGMLDNYIAAATSTAEKNSAFTSIENFVNGVSAANDQLKLKLWFQEMMNSRPARHALIVRMKGLALFSGLTKGTSPASLLTCPPAP